MENFEKSSSEKWSAEMSRNVCKAMAKYWVENRGKDFYQWDDDSMEKVAEKLVDEFDQSGIDKDGFKQAISAFTRDPQWYLKYVKDYEGK